jgi:hypothetical protein
MSIRLWSAALVVTTTFIASVTISGCGTRVGKIGANGGGSPPLAVITPIGYKPTSASGVDPVAITVRSGADVLLSGKDSDGLAVALKSFAWVQTGGPALPALPDVGALLYRTANTVSFRAPNVSTPTKLTFKLTVTNALDTSSTANAEVTVMPASDTNQFLISQLVEGPPPQRVQVVVATAEGLTGLTSDTPVCVKVARQVQYRGRLQSASDTPLVADLPQLPALQADTAWVASVDTVAAKNPDGSSNLANAAHSHTNPHLAFAIPSFNDEELFALYNQPAAGQTSTTADQQSKQLLPGDVDSARLLLSFSATPGSCDGATAAPALQAKTLVLAVVDDGGVDNVVLSSTATAPNAAVMLSQDQTGASLTSDSLNTSVQTPNDAPAETLASTTAYYKAIDPNSTKVTLDQWLDANCFDHTAADYGTGAAGANGAHAVYTNNFDLGFGRDMYFIKCAADHTDVFGNVAHAGDMASVVINYPSLEQTALKQAPIIAVAMEYSADPGGNGNHYAKFYVFAPNQRDGGFTRVASANFDKRGQKYVPGSCLSCHGGKVTDTTFASANVDATFMPWDLDALLYSDTDPAFKGFLTDGTPYTRKAQEPNLQKLNALAWQTWQVPEPIPASGTGTCRAITDPGCIDRFAAPLALLTKWYGGDPGATNAHAYDDSKTPDGWVITGQTAPNDLYHQAFAHQCRSCHTQVNVATQQFTDYPSFESNYITKDTNANRIQETIFRKAQMPLARLTADRFWSSYDGSTSPAQVLATQIKSVSAHDQVVDADGNFIPPGTPVLRGTRVSQVDSSTATSTESPIAADTTSGIYTIKRNDAAHVDISGSPFASTYSGTLCLKQTKDPTDSTPCVPQPVPLVGSTTALPAFNASNWGYYQLQVTSNNTLGTAATFAPIVINAPQTLPDISGCATQFAHEAIAISQDPNAPQILTMDVSQCAVLGDSPQLQLLNPTTGQWGTATLTDPAYVASPAGFKINFNFTLAAQQAVTLNYRLCDTADSICDASDNSSNTHPGRMNAPAFIDISSTYTALPRPYSMNLTANTTGSAPLANVLTIPVSCAGAATPPPSCATTAALTAGDTILPTSDTFNVLLGAATSGTAAPATQTTSTLNSGTITYTAPAGFVTCDINDKNINDTTQPCTPVSFTYTLQSTRNVQPVPSSQSNVTVKVNATTSFSQGGQAIYATLVAPACAGACHDATVVDCVANPADSHCKWQDKGTAAATLTQLTSNACKNVSPTGNACIVSGDPSTSQLYLNACVVQTPDFHPNRLQPGQCAILSQWLAEGAHVN